MFRRQFLALALPLAAAGCGARAVWAPDEAVARAAHRAEGPPSLTLVTVISNETEDGAHTGLVISGDQRVLFDPAGSWYHPAAPERNDVHYGITDAVLAHYLDYHTRVTYRTVVQRIEVAPEVAARAIARAEAAGPVAQGLCTAAVARVLGDLPGFEGLPQTLFPRVLSAAFGRLPGVTTETLHDDDDDYNRGLLAAR